MKRTETNNMRTFFICLALLIGTLQGNAQNNVTKWAKSISGIELKHVNGMAVDRSGNVYTTGDFKGSIDVDPGPDSFKLVSNGSSDIFIVKLDSNGNFVWGKSFGGRSRYNYDVGNDISTDENGNVYTTGFFSGTADFDPGPDSSILVSSTTNMYLPNAFISKLDSNGNLIWAKSFGGNLAPVKGVSLSIGLSGAIFISGSYRGKADFAPGPDTVFLTSSPFITNDFAYICKLDSNGNYVWVKSLDLKSGSIQMQDIALDNKGLIYACGFYSGSTDFNPGTDSTILTAYLGGPNLFILKLNTAGDYVWVKSTNNSPISYARGIAVDNSSNVYTTGYFSRDADFDPGSGISILYTSSNTSTCFISKLDSNGNYVWAKSLGRYHNQIGDKITLDQNGNVFTTGYFSGSADFDPGDSTFILNAANSYKPFISKLSSNGNFISAETVTGAGYGGATCISVDARNNVYTAGYFGDTLDFDNSSDTLNLINTGSNVDLFVYKSGTPTACASSSSVTNITLCSNQIPYSWNGINYSTSGTYTKSLVNATGCDSICILNLTVISTRIDAPKGISQTLVQKSCNSTIYRYTAWNVVNASGYSWTIPASVGGMTGVLIDSGDVTRDKVIRIKYTSNASASINDSIAVRAYFPCGNSEVLKRRLVNTAPNTPAAPSSLIITPVAPNACGAKIYRYSAAEITASLSNGSATSAPVTGYLWSFSNTELGNNAAIDSGTVNSRVILVRFTSLAAAAAGDSIRVNYTSPCGNGAAKASKLTNTYVNPPALPSSINVTPIIINVCNNRVYRFTAPALPGGSATSASATGYLWSLTNSNLCTNAIIDSGSFTSRILKIKFTSNDAATIADSIRLMYTSNCGSSLVKAIKLTNTLLQPPPVPSSFTITKVSDRLCGYTSYRLTAPSSLPGASLSSAASIGYKWDFRRNIYIGNYDYDIGLDLLIDSGSIESRVVRVSIQNPPITQYQGSGWTFNNDFIRLSYVSACDQGPGKEVGIGNHQSSSDYPAAPSSILITPVNTTSCGARIYRFTAPPLPAATATRAEATGYEWMFTIGGINGTGSIDSGSLTGRVIRMKYASNNAAGSGDSIRLRYSSICGFSAIKGQKLPINALSGCTAKNSSIRNNSNSNQALSEAERLFSVYPNPTSSYFNLKVNTAKKENTIFNIIDMNGRKIKSTIINSNDVIPFGSELQPGVYIIEVIQGNNRRKEKIVKF